MAFTDYRLPNGRIVPVQTDTADGAAIIDYTLANGRIVQAVRADIPPASLKTLETLLALTRKVGR